MDLRLPALSKGLGVRQTDPVHRFLTGETAASDFLRTVSANPASSVNNERLRNADEVILDKCAGETLNTMEARNDPGVVICDLPPMLSCDDVIGFFTLSRLHSVGGGG